MRVESVVLLKNTRHRNSLDAASGTSAKLPGHSQTRRSQNDHNNLQAHGRKATHVHHPLLASPLPSPQPPPTVASNNLVCRNSADKLGKYVALIIRRLRKSLCGSYDQNFVQGGRVRQVITDRLMLVLQKRPRGTLNPKQGENEHDRLRPSGTSWRKRGLIKSGCKRPDKVISRNKTKTSIIRLSLFITLFYQSPLIYQSGHQCRSVNRVAAYSVQ